MQFKNPYGLYHPSDWRINRVLDAAEYLVKNDSQNYEWVPSSNGNEVINAVIPGHTPGKRMYYIGRIRQNGYTYLGKVFGKWDGGEGIFYENGSDQEINASNYEVLTCSVEKKSKNEFVKDDQHCPDRESFCTQMCINACKCSKMTINFSAF